MTTPTPAPAKTANRIIGHAPCPLCSHECAVRITEKNKLYMTCAVSDGGCGHQLFCRDPKSELELARRITKWKDSNERRAYLGNDALPRKAKPPAPSEDPPPEDPPVDDPPPEDPPPPPPPAPRARAPRPAPKKSEEESEYKPLWARKW